jgi:hypothetical protein
MRRKNSRLDCNFVAQALWITRHEDLTGSGVPQAN